MYCPVCYFEITVPLESTIKPVDESQLYATNSEPVDVRQLANRKKFVSLRCPICNTNIAVTKEQTGQVLVCPECETKVRVPQSILAKFKRAEEEWDRIDRRQEPNDNLPFQPSEQSYKDVYGVSGDGDSDNNNPQQSSKTIRVYCKLCGTMMYASQSQIGVELICPDCETRTLVVAPHKSHGAASTTQSQIPPPPPPPLNFEGGKVFGLAGGVSQAETGLLVPVVCSLCGTRMYANESEIGGYKICPDCGRQNEIKAVPKSQKIKADVIQGGAYGVGQADDLGKRPVLRTLTDYRYVEGSVDNYDNGDETTDDVNSAATDTATNKTTGKNNNAKSSQGRGGLSMIGRMRNQQTTNYYETPKLPKYPFITRFFLSFTSSMLWMRIIITVWLIWAGIFICLILPSSMIILSAAFGFMIALFGFLYLSDTFYTLFNLTVTGNDLPDKEDWNDFRIIEFGAVMLWIFFLNIFSALPGYLVFLYLENYLLRAVGGAGVMIDSYLLSAFLLNGSSLIFFPIFFLSCVEGNSAFMLISKVTFCSLFSCFFVWCRFYFMSVLLFSFFCLATILISWATKNDSITTSILIIPVWVIIAMLYARYLGRLGWTLEEFWNKE
jgi:DNA-directed RNA polymerase subunit M/transcription elongation factor TFIIS